MRSRIIFINYTLYKKSSDFLFSYRDCHVAPLQHRSISSTSQLRSSWMDKIKGVFTGKNTPEGEPEFTLARFADKFKTVRRVGALRQFMLGKPRQPFCDEVDKREAIIRYLGGIDSNGENLRSSHIQEAAKHCNCTVADVENVLGNYLRVKKAVKMVNDFKKEGKPISMIIFETLVRQRVNRLVGMHCAHVVPTRDTNGAVGTDRLKNEV